MGAVYFYHLTRSQLPATLATLAEKSLAAGWRVAVRGTDGAALSALDETLWEREGFLPHGLAGGPHDALQPVLLTTGAAANGAVCVMSVNGAEIAPAEVADLARACVIFDGHDGAAIAHARGQWKAYKDAGVEAQYWSEESGSWQKKA